MQITERMSPLNWDYWRIVLTLAAKDIVDALKNKTTLTMILGLALMMLTVQALPLLLKLDNRPRVAIFDAARSGIADELRRGEAVQVLEMRTAADALAAAQETGSPLIAVVLPFDWQDGTGALMIDGYLAHWIRPRTGKQLVEQVEGVLTAVTQRPVTIQSQTVYPTPENRGHTIMVALGLVLAATMVTSILVPYLILEEKTTHTLDALCVSPASVSQMLLGKGLAGIVYGLLAAAALLAFNLPMINLWGLLLLAVLAIVLFGVGLGLLVGTLVENEGAVQMWVGLLALALLFPLMLVFVNSSRLPPLVQRAMDWLPTMAAFHLIRLSFGNTWSMAEVWPRVTAVLLATILVFAAAGWRLRTWEA